MKPIISPWIIYLINTLESLEFFLILLTAGFIIATIFIAMAVYDEKDADFKNKWKRKPIYLIICSIVFSIVIVLIPSKETAYTMLVTSQITPNNIEIVGDTTKDAVDYIVTKIEKLIEEDAE